MGSYWWAGNWWQGALPAVAPAGTPLDERIRNCVVSKLQTITVANGYNQTASVQRPPIGALEFEASDAPALVVRSSQKQARAHIRGAEEFILMFKVICIVANSGGDPDGDLAKLMGDVSRVVWANRRWHDGAEYLARRTWIPEDAVHEPEVEEATLTSSVTFEVLARANRQDLTQVKDV